MEFILRIIFGTLLIAYGIRATLGLFANKYRMKWKGSHVTAGKFSHLGLALVFILGGVILLLQNQDQNVDPIIGSFLLLGAVLTVIGYLIDE